MQRQTRIDKLTHPTKLEITMSHNFKGDKEIPTQWGGVAHSNGFDLYNYKYSPKSNLELFTCFQEMAIACGPVSEFGFNDISKRETEIKVNGVINGNKVIDQVFYGLVDFARFLKKHNVDVNWLEAAQQEKLEKKLAKQKPVESKLTDLHLRGFLNGDMLKDNEVRNTTELLRVLNLHSKDAKFAVVKDDEVVVPKELLQEAALKVALFDMMMSQGSREDEQEVAPQASQSGPRVVDITDSEPGEVMISSRRM